MAEEPGLGKLISEDFDKITAEICPRRVKEGKNWCGKKVLKEG